MTANELQLKIERAYSYANYLKETEAQQAIEESISLLDHGEIRVCQKEGREWKIQDWVKKAVLLYFRISKMKKMQAGDLSFFDKIPLKSWSEKEGVRVVPHAIVRRGAFVHSGCILMPSYINIGARVDEGTMVDTWVTVGSCAQVGKNVHLSGGVGLGGVLEPIQANPVIIEDHAFIGSRCIIVEGAVVEEGAVVAAGTVITSSTRIVDVTGSKEVIHRGRIPKNSVVIPGTTAKDFPAGVYQIPSALIIGKRDEKTDKKTSLTQVLREHSIVG